MKHEVVRKDRLDMGMDCEGFQAICSCGEELFGWTPVECDEKVKTHISPAVTKQEKTYSEIVALSQLKEIETKNSGLINGNFTAIANKNKIKVKRLRELYQNEKL